MPAHLHHYRAYGLTIGSEFALAELERCTPRAPDLLIRSGRLEGPSPAPGAYRSLRFSAEEQYFCYRAAGRFLVRGGSEVIVDCEENFDRRLLGLPLLGPILAAVLHCRGFLLLHGSCVRIGDAATILLGDKGAGKSTTAAHLVAHGFPLFGDDIVAIDLSDPDRGLVAQGHQAMKLDRALVDRLPVGTGHIIAPETSDFTNGKVRFRLNAGMSGTSLPLREALVLNRGKAVSTDRLVPKEAMATLIRFSYMLKFGREAVAATGTDLLFNQCAKLSKRVPVANFEVPDRLERLGEVAAFFERRAAQEAA